MPERQGPMVCNNTGYTAHIQREMNNEEQNIKDTDIIAPWKCKIIEPNIEGFDTKGYSISMTKGMSDYAGEISTECSSDEDSFPSLTIEQEKNKNTLFFQCKMGITQQTKQKLGFIQPLKQKQTQTQTQTQTQIQEPAQEPINSMYAEALKDLGFNPNASASLYKILKD